MYNELAVNLNYLDISEAGLGVLSPDLGNLTNLTNLVLKGNPVEEKSFGEKDFWKKAEGMIRIRIKQTLSS